MLRQGCIVVLDIGKTLAKLTLWSPERRFLQRRIYRNKGGNAAGYPALDIRGIEHWLAEGLSAFARLGDIAAIIPVGHGAAACVVEGDELTLASLDYEAEPPDEICSRYRGMRDPFALTGSPLLPAGLNLGRQLLWLQTVAPDKFARGVIVTWPQFWAWRLSGVAATEVTSLGCHTDLWVPAQGKPSPMAVAAGWADRFAPLRQAGEVLGPVTREWIGRCKLPADCAVVCGLHDSNAALLAARGFAQIGERDFTILSTGTWFVAMRSMRERGKVDLASLPESRDCLVNVDVTGMPVPSARFMGGREAELLEMARFAPVDVAEQKDLFLRDVERMVRAGTFALPAFQKGVGPFPRAAGYWIRQPGDQISRRALVGLYLALVTGVCLDLIGSDEPVVVEGRFADDPIFAAALAALHPHPVYKASAADSIAHGALRLVDPALPAQADLQRVEPLGVDISGYAAEWRSRAGASELMTAT